MNKILFYFEDGKRVKGVHIGISGDISRIYGNVSKIYGNVSRIFGNVSRISGNVSEISGNVSKISGDVSGISGYISQIYDKYFCYKLNDEIIIGCERHHKNKWRYKKFQNKLANEHNEVEWWENTGKYILDFLMKIK